MDPRFQESTSRVWIIPSVDVEASALLTNCLLYTSNSVKKTGRVLLVNDAHKTGGFIGEIAAMIAESDAFDFLDNRILRLAAEDVPVPYNAKLEAAMLPSVERIKKYILKLVNKR